MVVQPEDLEAFVDRKGPVHVVSEDGSAVTYAVSARLDALDSTRKDAWTVDQLKLTLFDEQSRPVRSIAGDRILRVEGAGPGYTIIVDDTVEREPGDGIRTRGA